jgi:hypothetical protein
MSRSVKSLGVSEAIGIQSVAEVEVLDLYPMLAGCHASTDILVLTDGGKGGVVLDPAQHLRYTWLDHEVSSRGPGLRVFHHRRGHLLI